jgi:hypothetical protein
MENHHFFMGKLTMSMAIFNSYFDITRGYLPTFARTKSLKISLFVAWRGGSNDPQWSATGKIRRDLSAGGHLAMESTICFVVLIYERYLSISVSILISIHISLNMSIHTYIQISIHMCIQKVIHISIRKSIHTSIHISVQVSIHISSHTSIDRSCHMSILCYS